MYKACFENDRNLVYKLIKEGNIDFNEGLIGACSAGNREFVELMIFNGANNYNWGLFGACEGGHEDLVDLMITYGATNYNMGLKGACYGKNTELVKYMIFLGATKLHYLKYGNLECKIIYNKIFCCDIDISEDIINEHKLYRLLPLVDNNLLRIVNKYLYI